MRPVTKHQLDILRCIADWIDEHGWPPTLREICDQVGSKSTNAVSDTISALDRKGCLERKFGMARAIRVTAAGRQLLGEVPPDPDPDDPLFDPDDATGTGEVGEDEEVQR